VENGGALVVMGDRCQKDYRHSVRKQKQAAGVRLSLNFLMPVSPTLMAAPARHAEERHAPPDGRLLRYTNGRPVTYRRYDGLWVRGAV
jgi:hypothetical protein